MTSRTPPLLTALTGRLMQSLGRSFLNIELFCKGIKTRDPIWRCFLHYQYKTFLFLKKSEHFDELCIFYVTWESSNFFYLKLVSKVPYSTPSKAANKFPGKGSRGKKIKAYHDASPNSSQRSSALSHYLQPVQMSLCPSVSIKPSLPKLPNSFCKIFKYWEVMRPQKSRTKITWRVEGKKEIKGYFVIKIPGSTWLKGKLKDVK